MNELGGYGYKNPDIGISVYVADAQKRSGQNGYEDTTVGGWIDLPVTDEELNTFLDDTVGVIPDAEPGEDGYVIYDYAFKNGLELLDYKPDEYTDINDLNLLAKCVQIANTTNVNFEAIRTYMAQERQNAMPLPGPLEYANIIFQADEIPFYTYDLPENMTMADCSSLSEALGYDLARNNLRMENILEVKVDGEALGKYFDYKLYGAAHSSDYLLSGSGYLNPAIDGPDTDWYDRDDLDESLGRQWDVMADLWTDQQDKPITPEAERDAGINASRKEQSHEQDISPAASKDNATRAVSARKDQSATGRSNPARS